MLLTIGRLLLKPQPHRAPHQLAYRQLTYQVYFPVVAQQAPQWHYPQVRCCDARHLAAPKAPAQRSSQTRTSGWHGAAQNPALLRSGSRHSHRVWGAQVVMFSHECGDRVLFMSLMKLHRLKCLLKQLEGPNRSHKWKPSEAWASLAVIKQHIACSTMSLNSI